MEKSPNKLSVVDRRIVQLMSAKKPVDFIADLIGKPVDLVMEAIDAFTSAEAGRKSYEQQKEEKQKLKEQERERRQEENRAKLIGKRKRKKAAKVLKKVNDESEKKQRGRVRVSPQPYLDKAPKKKVFANRKQDLSQQVAVRVDSKTIIYINAGADIEMAIRKYKERHQSVIKLGNHRTVVKKIKPIK